MPASTPLASDTPCDALHISSVHPYDDIRIIYRECAVLRHAGFAVEAAFFDTPAAGMVADVPLLSLGQRPHSRLLRAWRATQAARKLVHERNPRIVHLHDPELLPLAHQLRRIGLTVFYDAHEDLPRQVLHKSWIPARLRPLVSALMQRSLPRLLSAADAVIVAARHIDAGWIAGQRRVLLRNMPLASRRHSAPERPFEIREPAVVYAGLISAARQVHLGVQAALAADAQRVYLAGRGNADYVRSLTELAPERVQYLGQLEPGPLDALLGRCRAGLALLPAVPAYLEAVPSKVFDYLKAGLPFVWSDFPHWHDALNHELTAYAVEPNASADLQAKLRHLLHDPTGWRSAHRAVVALSRRYPSAEEESAELIELYQAELERAA